MCAYITGLTRSLWRPRKDISSPLGLELQTTVGCAVDAGREPRSSDRAQVMFNHWAFSPAPNKHNLKKKIFLFFEADSHVATIGLKLSVQPRVTLNFPASSLSLPSSVISLYGAGNGTPHARNSLPIKELWPRFFYFFEVRVMCWDHLSILFWDV